MSTTSTTPAAAAPSQSYIQKIDAWFKKVGSELENALTKAFGSTVARDIAVAAKSLLGTALGSVAVEAVTAATNVETGTISASQAKTAIVAAAKSAGTTLADSAVNLLVSTAQAAVESKLGITTTLVS